MRCRPCKAPASSSGAVRVGYLDTQLGRAGDRTSDLAVTSQPANPLYHLSYCRPKLAKDLYNVGIQIHKPVCHFPYDVFQVVFEAAQGSGVSFDHIGIRNGQCGECGLIPERNTLMSWIQLSLSLFFLLSRTVSPLLTHSHTNPVSRHIVLMHTNVIHLCIVSQSTYS